MRYKFFALSMFLSAIFSFSALVQAEPQTVDPVALVVTENSSGKSLSETLFDDKLLIDGYALKIAGSPKDILLAMINDDNLVAYRKAAATRVFREVFADQMVSRERVIIERVFLRQLQRSVSPYVQVEIMHTLMVMDRYRYFDAMVPALIQKIDHYDQGVNELAYKSVAKINETGSQRSREARIIFNTLRKIFFLSRKKLANADLNDPRLKNKLELLRWSIKVLGTEELRNLPKEVISLM